MKKDRTKNRSWLIKAVIVLLLFSSTSLMAQVFDPGAQMAFRQEELDQMLAPIALYPDDLLSQILMASTYPLEVVQAARWVQSNPNIQGDQLAMVLETMNWDPSVKALVNFPYVLQMMNDRLEWMGRLGDAFLAQPEQIMATVQMLRERARAQGHLMNTNEQRVMVDPQSRAIIIEPVAPQVIYVPVYDPLVVFGPWWWPAYPPYFYHPVGLVIRPGFVGFGPRIVLTHPWGYAWGICDWRQRRVVVDINRNMYINNRINRPRYAPMVTSASHGRGTWLHDPNHRQGMAYRTPEIAQKFGRGPLPGAENRRVYRGYEGPHSDGRFSPPTPRQGTIPPRVTSSPVTVRPEGQNQPIAPVQNYQVGSSPNGRISPVTPRPETTPPRVTSSPVTVRPEGQNQPIAPVQNYQVMPAPKVSRPEPPKPSSPSGPPPRVTPSPSVPVLPNATAFSQVGPSHQVRQDSTRGHESLGGNRGSTPAPSGGLRPSPGGGSSGSGPSGGGPSRHRGK